MELQKLLGALPDAATSPYAFVAYVFLVIASAVIAWRVKRNKNLLNVLEKIPPEQRAKLIATEMGTPVPPGMTAEQWLKYKIHQYYLLAFLSILICGTVIFTIAYSNPKATNPEWDSQSAISGLKIGTTKEYARTLLGVPPVSEDFSDRFELPEGIIYERYSDNDKELQVLYMNNQVTTYALRTYGESNLHKIIRSGNPEWIVGKTKFTQAGNDPQYSDNDFHWGKSICQIEQHYYGRPGEYNDFYFSLNKVDSEGALSRESAPSAVMVSKDICSSITDESAKDECDDTLRGMACTSADDFEG